MGSVVKTFTFSTGDIIYAAEHNTNYDTLYTLVNGNIDNDNVSATAAIAFSKLAALADGKILVGNASGVATAVTLSGDATIDNLGSLQLADRTITTSDIAVNTITYGNISASAAISFSQLESLTDTYVVVSNGSNVATGVAVSGDATITNAGVLTVANGVITPAKLEGTAKSASIEFFIDGGGSAITTGVKGYVELPFDCTIDRGTLLADQTCNVTVDVWRSTYAAYPPTDSDSITASAPLTITSGVNVQDSTLTGWSTTVTSSNILGFNVDSVDTATFLTVSLKVTRT